MQNSDYYLKYLKYKNKYINLKMESIKGGASHTYVFGMINKIDNLSEEDAKFWYDVLIEIMNINNNVTLKNEYRVQDNNKAKFKSIHHFFTFGIFDNIVENMSKEDVMNIYIERFRWNYYINFNNTNHWARLLLNYRDTTSSSFGLPEDKFIAEKSDCLNDAIVEGDHKNTLKNLFWCLVNVPNPKINVNTEVKTHFNESKQ